MSLGNRLYEMRKAKGLSQEKAAELLGVTRQTVSKWETNQSTPDFDKIIPLCELYGISTEELLKGESSTANDTYIQSSKEGNSDDRFNYYTDAEDDINGSAVTEKPNGSRKKFALFISTAVCMYILSVVPLIAFDGSTVSVVVFFVIIALATMLVVFGVLSKPKGERAGSDVMTRQKTLYKQITGILSGITLCIFLAVSFISGEWGITWIIWIIYGIVCKIIDLILTLKEDEKVGKE